MEPEPLSIAIGEGSRVSALLQRPAGARAGYALAHGAGAGMTHPFMAATATGLHDRGIATLRYQFAYMESGSRRPDAPALAHAAVRAAVREANARLPGVPLIAGGKSFGGRMTSQAQAEESLANVRGLAFLGFPLHPAGKPSVTRAQHLFAVRIPILFLQGTRDALADPALIATVTGELKGRATLISFEDADHSFHVAARTGRRDADIRAAMVNATAEWIDATSRMTAEPPLER